MQPRKSDVLDLNQEFRFAFALRLRGELGDWANRRPTEFSRLFQIGDEKQEDNRPAEHNDVTHRNSGRVVEDVRSSAHLAPPWKLPNSFYPRSLRGP